MAASLPLTALPPHKALGRDFFVVGAQLAPVDEDNDAAAAADRSVIINTTIHKTLGGGGDGDHKKLCSISDWLIKTLQNTPYFLLRIIARRGSSSNNNNDHHQDTTSSCCLLDFGGIRHMLVLLGDDIENGLPSDIPQLSLSVQLAGVSSASGETSKKQKSHAQQHAMTTSTFCSLQDSIWEHVVVAIDQNGSEQATRLYIRTERAGSVSRESIALNTPTIHLWSKSTANNKFHLDRMVQYASVTEAFGGAAAQGSQQPSSKRRPETAAAAASNAKPSKKNKTVAAAATATETPDEPQVLSVKPAVADAAANDDATKTKKKRGKALAKKAIDAVIVDSTATAASSESVASDSSTPAAAPDAPAKAAATNNKRKKDPNQPKKAQTAYNYFFSERMIKSRKEHPEELVGFHSKSVAAEWKAMSDADKKKYEELSAKDHERYRMAMEMYVPASDDLADDDEDDKKKKRSKKDPDAPKKPMSAYLRFCNERRPKLKDTHPDKGFGDLTKLVSKEWGELTPEEKQKYEDAAKDAKEQYGHDKSAYDSAKSTANGDDEANEAGAVEPAVKDAATALADRKKEQAAPSPAKGAAPSKKVTQHAKKLPDKHSKPDDDDSSSSSSDSHAKTVGEDSDSSSSSTDSEPESKPKASKKDADSDSDSSSSSDDDSSDDEHQVAGPGGTKKRDVPTSPRVLKKTGKGKPVEKSSTKDSKKPDGISQSPKRSPRSKTSTAVRAPSPLPASSKKKSKPGRDKKEN